MAQACLTLHDPALGAQSAAKLAAFANVLRANGFAIGLAESRDAFAVLASPAGRRPVLLKPALRALFSATREDWRRFDEFFDAFWRGKGMRKVQPLRGGAAASAGQRRPLPPSFAPEAPPGAKESAARDDEGGGASTMGDRRDAASSAEALESRDIRYIADPLEMAKVHALAERFARRMRARLVRRWRARRAGPRLDLRRTVHHSVAHGGTPIDLVWRRRKLRPLRLVLLLDASGSMELYTAFFARFLHAAVDAFREAEAFVFHTRLVHVSSALRERDVARAVDRLALMAQGIGGGTRIGESLADFNRWHAARVINSRTAVVIVSDGYDTGEPERLGLEMQRLARRARRIVWLNPLLGWRDYEPTARGMRAALPYIDLFAPAHNLESLAALEPYLARI
ncbi:MAG: VWA domain-containing protein [Hyphomicrobiales bacterium]|nr:VWA domain-containing protein [Hyphomicrobiales bacterium]